MNDYFEWLGYEVRDRVTGFAGVADSVCFDLYGCVQVSITPKCDDKDKERKSGYWFDVKRLEKTSCVRVLEPPKWSMPGDENGPADKSPRF
jgi:hypothetical protein